MSSRAGAYESPLALATEAARAAGERLRAELHLPGGAEGEGGHAPVDTEVEHALRARLLGGTPYSFLGEETGAQPGADPSHCWIVDPNDGTRAFLQGSRVVSVSIALTRDGVPVLGVVYAYAAPDDEGDLFTWAEGCGPLRRNGVPVEGSLAQRDLGRYEMIYISGSAEPYAPEATLAVAPARFHPLPSIAYRLALVAAGEGVATVAFGNIRSWDIAAGHALVCAAEGVVVDGAGKTIVYGPLGEIQAEHCFGGAPAAVKDLQGRSYEASPRQIVPSTCAYDLLRPAPGRLVTDAGQLRRAQGCLLGQLAGDALGALVEFGRKGDIAAAYPQGLDMQDGGLWSTLAGQPTDDSEMALMLARSVVAYRAYAPGAALDAYLHWYRSRPFDMRHTIRRALGAAALADTTEEALAAALAAADPESESNSSLMRVSPLGILGAGRPRDAAAWAREDSALTHPSAVCREACAAFVAAIAVAIAGGGAEGAYAAAQEEAARGGAVAVREALAAAREAPPEIVSAQAGSVRIALQNAFYRLLHAPSLEQGIVDTASEGGDADTNAAIAGALLGAVHGREAVPVRWRRLVLTCRPIREASAARVRPPEFWPIDALILAEALLVTGR
ncbi:inositol monophosphatase family protein [Chondromyces apiculatus]|uniref:ADP-ribosylglycohydrolase n=1 Tax=Chondromyces apiculatus DSM 436 TaxID=1192034 RepID=A0A017TD50_9BACT|nr:inositol monophosphatase family protein [Chondromyces apiculatus]EYF06745.1 ADP-ribosylglycohydrolase [Chondromyces apiculatus DSM 436]